MKESVKVSKVSVQIFIRPASDAGEKKKGRDSIPRNYQERRTWERKNCLLGLLSRQEFRKIELSGYRENES